MADSAALLVDEVLPHEPMRQWVLSMLFLDGVYSGHRIRFHLVKAPSSTELTQLTHTIAQRIGRYLERQGFLVRDAENSYLTLDAIDEGPMDHLLGSSITYRIAVGPCCEAVSSQMIRSRSDTD